MVDLMCISGYKEVKILAHSYGFVPLNALSNHISAAIYIP